MSNWKFMIALSHKPQCFKINQFCSWMYICTSKPNQTWLWYANIPCTVYLFHKVQRSNLYISKTWTHCAPQPFWVVLISIRRKTKKKANQSFEMKKVITYKKRKKKSQLYNYPKTRKKDSFSENIRTVMNKV